MVILYSKASYGVQNILYFSVFIHTLFLSEITHDLIYFILF